MKRVIEKMSLRTEMSWNFAGSINLLIIEGFKNKYERFSFPFSRRPRGLRGQEVLLAPLLPGQRDVCLLGRPRGGLAAQAAALRLRLLLPTGSIPLRGRRERTELCQEGHLRREVS